jgi:hypothetical protein
MTKSSRTFLVAAAFSMAALAMLGSPPASANVMHDAFLKLADLVISIDAKLSGIGQKAERDYVIDRLFALNDKLYRIELDKEMLLLLMRRGAEGEVGEATRRLMSDVEEARGIVRDVGGKLVLQQAAGLDEELREAITSRKEWLPRVIDGPPEGLQSPGLQNEGRAAIAAVQAARRKLADLLLKLSKE